MLLEFHSRPLLPRHHPDTQSTPQTIRRGTARCSLGSELLLL